MEPVKIKRELTREECAAFLKAAANACPKWGQGAAFECPVCHGTATAMRSGYNGHLMANCTGCGANFRQ